MQYVTNPNNIPPLLLKFFILFPEVSVVFTHINNCPINDGSVYFLLAAEHAYDEGITRIQKRTRLKLQRSAWCCRVPNVDQLYYIQTRDIYPDGWVRPSPPPPVAPLQFTLEGVAQIIGEGIVVDNKGKDYIAELASKTDARFYAVQASLILNPESTLLRANYEATKNR